MLLKENTFLGHISGKSRKTGEYRIWPFTITTGKHQDQVITVAGQVFNNIPAIQRRSILGINGSWVVNKKKNLFIVSDIIDMPLRASQDDVLSIGNTIGINVSKEHYTGCLEALGVDNFYEAAGLLSSFENRSKLNRKVGKEAGNSFYSLVNYVSKESDLSSIVQMFYEANTGLDISHAIRLTYHLRRRSAFTKLSITELLKKYPWLLLQVFPDDKEAAENAAEAIVKYYKIPNDVSTRVRIASEVISFLLERSRQGDSFVYSSYLYGRLYNKYSRDEVNSAFSLLTNNTPFSKTFGRVVSEKTFLPEVIEDTGRYPYKDKGKSIDKVYAFYLPGIYFSEVEAAKRIAEINQGYMEPWDAELLLSHCDSDLDQRQIELIEAVANNKIVILTGEAGTGKTRVLKNLINACEKAYGFIPEILGPTALSAYRAAYDTVGEEKAKTVHRYAAILNDELDLAVDIKALIAATTEEDIDTPRLIILDEGSMLGPVMLRKLLNKIDDSTRLVISGDPAQLPPIGPAGIFTGLIDLAKDGIFKHVELTVNHRSGEDVIKAAQAVRKGLPIEFNDNVILVTAPKNKLASQCVSVIQDLLQDKNLKDTDLLVLAPTREKGIGTYKLNEEMRKVFGSGEKILNTNFEINDPVVAKRNDYAELPGMTARAMRQIRLDRNDVYNGMVGAIDRCNDDSVKIHYSLSDHTETREYLPEELGYYLEPAYSMTVHKAQGGQAKYIILVMGSSYGNRSLIYTALTRCAVGGKVIVVSTPDFEKALYAAENWEDLILNDDSDALPATRCLSKFKYRVKYCMAQKQVAFV